MQRVYVALFAQSVHSGPHRSDINPISDATKLIS
jgi:hypothetical protein